MTTSRAAIAELPAEGLLDRVRAVTPTIAERSFEAEAQRRPLDEVVHELESTGVFRSFVPSRYGGYEIDISTFIDIGLAVAYADPSMGWVTTFYMEHNWLLTMFCEELQDEIFGASPYVLAPGSINPKSGTAERCADGGLCLSGHWQFGTGICHADWVLLSGTIVGEETTPRQFLVPVDAVEVRDTWYVDGMVATGSRDIVATGVMVPEQRVSLRVPPHVTAGLDAPYLHRIPVAPMLSITAGMPAVGAARRALDLFRELLVARVQFGTKRTQANRVPSQVRLANLVVEVDAVETLLRDVGRRMQAHIDGEAVLDLPGQQLLRLSVAHIVRRCRDVVREILASSGASVHYLDHELQRLQRDVHMIAAHTVFDVDLLAEGVGRVMVERLAEG